MSPSAFSDRIRSALGSSRVVSLPGLPSQGPLDLVHLARELSRLQAEAHETPPPRTPPWPLTTERRKELEALARELKKRGTQVSPEQLAELLLSSAMEQLKTFLRGTAPLEDAQKP